MTDNQPPEDEPGRQRWDRRTDDRPSTLGDAGMPSAGRPPASDPADRPAATGPTPPADRPAPTDPGPPAGTRPGADPATPAAGSGMPAARDETLDPEAPLAADGDTVRLASAMTVPEAATAPEAMPGTEPGAGRASRPADRDVGAGGDATEVAGAHDEPTAVVEPPVAPGDGPTAGETPGDERTTPPTVSVDDEATVVSDRRSFDGGSTMRLQPPFFAPGTTRTPRPAPPPEEPGPLDEAVESRQRWESSPAWPPADETDETERDTPERWRDGFARAAAAADAGAAADRAAASEAAADTAAREQAAADRAATAQTGTDRVTADRAATDRGATDRAAFGRADDVVGGQAVAGKVPANEPVSPGEVTVAGGDGASAVPGKAPSRRLTPAGALIWVLLALLGFTLVVQLQSNDDDAGLATARQEDLVGILSDLEARDQRLQQEINALEESERQLTSGVAGRQAALAEAGKRADELGLLSGTLPARGPGLKISIDPKGQPIKASAILNAVQELRGAGGEVMEIVGDNGVAVRIVASSYFVDAGGGQVLVDGKQLSGPYTLWVIGVPATMQTALQIPGGVVASVSQAGGNVTMEQRTTVEVAAVRQPTSLQYARPVS